MSVKQVKKIIFDNDGVNIDSEDVAMQVMDDFGFDMVTKYIGEPDLQRGDIYKEYPGTSTDKIVQALINRFDLPYEGIKSDYNLGDIPDKEVATMLADKITIETNNAFLTRLNAITGISQALVEIDRQLGGIENRALATTSRADRMKISLEQAIDPETGENAGLATLFPDEGNRRISGYDYDNKYEYALELLGWDPSETVVVEDSISGVTKAKTASAEFRVIGTVAAKFYTVKKDQIAKLKDAGADIIVTDVRDIPKAIEWLNNGCDMHNFPSGELYGSIHHNQPLGPPKPTHDVPELTQ